ncbi:MAG: lysophospholipid acyltransferase family protein [Gemmatimonadota bacterium]|jgi:KDO2-lipid IV(A) lauroyltransferase
MSERRPRLSDRVEDAALGAALAAAGLIGPRLAQRIGARLGRLGYQPLGIRRPQVEAHLRIAFPDRDKAWIRRTAAAAYGHLGREMVNTMLATRSPGDIPGAVRYEGLELVERGLEAGRGVVLVGGHLGNWELGAGAVAQAGLPVTAVARQQRNPLFDRRILAVRRGLGMELVDRNDAAREALRALRENRVVVFIADQDARQAGVFVPFFNRPASTPRGPAVLALRARAGLAFFAPIREPDGALRVRVEPLEVPDCEAGGPPVTAITATWVASLERAVREVPEQYLWHHRRWKTSPPEPSLDPHGSNGLD